MSCNVKLLPVSALAAVDGGKWMLAAAAADTGVPFTFISKVLSNTRGKKEREIGQERERLKHRTRKVGKE